MKKLVAFYSRADENYFDGSYRYIEVGNTEKVARMIAGIKGADMFRIEQKIPYAADYSTATAQAKKQEQVKNYMDNQNKTVAAKMLWVKLES